MPIPEKPDGAAVADATDASNALADGVYRVVDEQSDVDARTVTASRGGTPTTVQLGAPIHPTRVLLFSTMNDNSSFDLYVWYRDKNSAPGLLVMGSTMLLSNGSGSDSTGVMVGFRLTPAEATTAATILRTRRQDRHPVGDLVVGTFAPSKNRYVGPNDLVEIVFTMKNPATAPAIKYRHGGAQRGPRDDQFAFTITRDGVPVPPIAAMNFGGLSSMPPLAPGASVEIRTPLAGWGDITPKGHYVVECSWTTELAPGDADPYADDQRGAMWDRVFTGRTSFDVR